MPNPSGAALVVAAEGLPGCGKSTVLRKARHALRKRHGLSVRTISIDSPRRRHVRSLRRIADAFPHGHAARLLVLWALRILQYEDVRAQLLEYDVILLDRSWETTVVYDGHMNGVPHAVLAWLYRQLPLKADMTVLLSVPWSVAMSRKISNTLSTAERAQKLERGYELLSRCREWEVIDATKPPEDVAEKLVDLIEKKVQGELKRGAA